MVKVLLTADFERSYVEHLASDFPNILVEQIPFIHTSINPAQKDSSEALNDDSYDCWVFTSKNAVKALQPYAAYQKSKHIACVGSKTRELLESLGYKVSFYAATGSAELAKELAKAKNIKKVLFLAGNQHLSIIHNTLSSVGKQVNTHIVYETQELAPTVALEQYEGILFCSPSAVQSFEKQYKLNDIQKPLFAIGNTTAESIRKLQRENVFLAAEANLHALLMKASHHFK